MNKTRGATKDKATLLINYSELRHTTPALVQSLLDKTSTTSESISDDRLNVFKKRLRNFFGRELSQCSVKHIMKNINHLIGTDDERVENFTENEVAAALKRMTSDNQVMVAEGNVYLI